MELLPDDGHQRRNAKPSKKANKEGDPGDVKGVHLQAFPGKNIEFTKRLCVYHSKYVWVPKD
jgi:hypothetical protein